jgi:hypothetical protein
MYCTNDKCIKYRASWMQRFTTRPLDKCFNYTTDKNENETLLSWLLLNPFRFLRIRQTRLQFDCLRFSPLLVLRLLPPIPASGCSDDSSFPTSQFMNNILGTTIFRHILRIWCFTSSRETVVYPNGMDN